MMGRGFYWAEDADGAGVCIEADDAAHAAAIATEHYGVEPSAVSVLPYPAHPRLNHRSGCPTFCHQPEKCKGSRSCRAQFMCDH